MKLALATDVIVSGLRGPNGASWQFLTVVEAEGTTINQFVNVAIAEKLAALRTERYFQERAARANRSVA